MDRKIGADRGPDTICALPIWTESPCQARATVLIAFSLLMLLPACRPADEPQAELIRPVRVVTIEKLPSGETVSFTGHIKAEDEVNLSFGWADE